MQILVGPTAEVAGKDRLGERDKIERGIQN